MRRRRFLQIAAACCVAGPAQAAGWQGVALGADVAVQLDGPGAEAALAEVPGLLARIEAVFSLYRDSELSRINAAGGGVPSRWMAEVLALADRLHGLTGGVFDPTVQPLWRALAEGGDGTAARAVIGWDRVVLAPDLRLAPGQALTLNGVVQGWASDLVRDWLAARGFTRALVNIGEYAALGGPFRLGIADPVAGILAERHLSGGALATSSPGAMLVGGQGHILHPKGYGPRWSTVAVEADSAALADGLSTALVFADRAGVAAVRAQVPEVRAVVLVDFNGDLQVV